MLNRLQKWARHLNKESHALRIAYQDPRVPWYAKILVIIVIAHTFSPVDLIPDFIPILGYLDDLIIIPLGLALALNMIPAEVMVEARMRAESEIVDTKGFGRIGLILVLSIWIGGMFVIGVVLRRFITGE